MVKQLRKQKGAIASIRLNPDDKRIMDELRRKLGVDYSQIVRLAIRALLQKEAVPGQVV